MCLPARLGSGCTICFSPASVLQRDEPTCVWGWAEPRECVTLAVTDKTPSSTNAAGRSWKIELPAVPRRAALAARTLLEPSKTKTIMFEDVHIRNVWLLGGVSKMESPIYRIENGALEVASDFLKTFYE
jgi:sialate O-acetylesterase